MLRVSEDRLPELPERLDDQGDAMSRHESSDLEQALLLLPNLVKLTYRLLRDPRVASRDKRFALFALGYALSPIDLIPDVVPGIGRLDDLLVVAVALKRLLRSAGPDVVAAHWDGRSDVLYAVDSVLAAGAEALPRRLGRRRLGPRLFRA